MRVTDGRGLTTLVVVIAIVLVSGALLLRCSRDATDASPAQPQAVAQTQL
jgi:hypothetical protein